MIAREGAHNLYDSLGMHFKQQEEAEEEDASLHPKYEQNLEEQHRLDFNRY